MHTMESQMISMDRILGPCFKKYMHKKYMHKLLLVQLSIFETTTYI